MPDQAPPQFLGQLLAEGGFAMIPIYLCSVVALTVFLKKLFELKRAQISDLSWFDGVLDLIKRGDFKRAGNACEKAAHPATRVVRGVTHALQDRPERTEAEARRIGSLELQRLEKYLPILSFIAQVAPLLGLLGTVLGMVDLFMSLQGAGQGAVDVSVLSSGIWKALLTTAAGLTVAVPALAGHSYLASQADRVRLQLSDVIQRMMFALPSSVDPKAPHGV